MMKNLDTFISNIKILRYRDPRLQWHPRDMGKCHCNQIVTVTRGSLVTNQSFGNCKYCHCNRFVTVTGVTVADRLCTKLCREIYRVFVPRPFQSLQARRLNCTLSSRFVKIWSWFCLELESLNEIFSAMFTFLCCSRGRFGTLVFMFQSRTSTAAASTEPVYFSQQTD